MSIVGKPGRLVELRKGDVRVPEYQRAPDQARIRRYAREFDWFLFGVLYVSYRSPDYYVVDGLHRLEASRLVPCVDTVPAILYEFEGPQHEAEVFVKLQRYRKPLVTKDIQSAELQAGGDFGAIARKARDFIEGLHCETVPLATIRKLYRQKPEAFARVEPLISSLVGPLPLAKDFLEAIVYLEDRLAQKKESLATDHQRQPFDTGYERLLDGMQQFHQREHTEGRLGKVASPNLKADALRWALFEGGYRFEPIEHQGELIGARIGIPHLGLSNEEPPLSPEGFATSSRATVTHTPHPSLP